MGAAFRLGSVPYVNAIPLVHAFQSWQDLPVSVHYDVPSQLPARLQQGDVDAILVSTFFALSQPGLRMADGVGIASNGPVKSVRLFSKVDPAKIKTLALDASSMTSNALAQIVLRERYDARFTTTSAAPDLRAMLSIADACVLIGDIGMEADAPGLQILDLGLEWQKLTQKPFVWAAWVGHEGLTPGLTMLLQTAAHWSMVGRKPRTSFFEQLLAYLMRGEDASEAAMEVLRTQRLEDCIQAAKQQVGWPEFVIRDYFTNVMIYDLDERMMDGLRTYQAKLVQHGFLEAGHFPAIVGASLQDLPREVGLSA